MSNNTQEYWYEDWEDRDYTNIVEGCAKIMIGCIVFLFLIVVAIFALFMGPRQEVYLNEEIYIFDTTKFNFPNCCTIPSNPNCRNYFNKIPYEVNDALNDPETIKKFNELYPNF